MPSTRKQMRAAGQELRKRRAGQRRQQQQGKETRPFGAASEETLSSFAEWPKPDEQRRAARREVMAREAGARRQQRATRAFGNEPDSKVRKYAKASDAQLRRMNGQS